MPPQGAGQDLDVPAICPVLGEPVHRPVHFREDLARGGFPVVFHILLDAFDGWAFPGRPAFQGPAISPAPRVKL